MPVPLDRTSNIIEKRAHHVVGGANAGRRLGGEHRRKRLGACLVGMARQLRILGPVPEATFHVVHDADRLLFGHGVLPGSR